MAGQNYFQALIDLHSEMAQHNPSGSERFALLTMTSTEKTIFGPKKQGDMIVGDAPMRTVAFTDRKIVGLGTTLEYSREELEKLSLEVIAEAAARQLAARKSHLAEYVSSFLHVDRGELKNLADSASEVFVRTIGKDFPVVSGPAPDVLRVRVAITDLKQSRPGLSAVTTVVPVGLAVSLVKKGSSDSWTGSGATTAEMLVLVSAGVVVWFFFSYSFKYSEMAT